MVAVLKPSNMGRAHVCDEVLSGQYSQHFYQNSVRGTSGSGFQGSNSGHQARKQVTTGFSIHLSCLPVSFLPASLFPFSPDCLVFLSPSPSIQTHCEANKKSDYPASKNPEGSSLQVGTSCPVVRASSSPRGLELLKGGAGSSSRGTVDHLGIF